MRTQFITLVAFAMALPLFAGNGPTSFGVEGGLFRPSGTWRGDYSNTSVTNPPNGYTFGLSMQFKSDSRYQGRIRLGYITTGMGPESQVSYSAPQPLPVGQNMLGRQYWRAITFGYDWMPHLFNAGQNGPFAILGAHVAHWSRRTSNMHSAANVPSTTPNYSTDSSTNFSPAFLPTLGLGYRFNPRSTLEARFIQSSSVSSIGNGGKGVLVVATFRF